MNHEEQIARMLAAMEAVEPFIEKSINYEADWYTANAFGLFLEAIEEARALNPRP